MGAPTGASLGKLCYLPVGTESKEKAMYPTLLDTKTGKTCKAKEMESSLFWWAEGNGSCDCNRAIAMGSDIDDEMEKQFGEGVCFGCTRIVVIDVHGDLCGMPKHEIIDSMNKSYDVKKLLYNCSNKLNPQKDKEIISLIQDILGR